MFHAYLCTKVPSYTRTYDDEILSYSIIAGGLAHLIAKYGIMERGLLMGQKLRKKHNWTNVISFEPSVQHSINLRLKGRCNYRLSDFKT